MQQKLALLVYAVARLVMYPRTTFRLHCVRSDCSVVCTKCKKCVSQSLSHKIHFHHTQSFYFYYMTTASVTDQKR